MKEEFRLTYKQGAIAVLHRAELEDIPDSVKEKITHALDGMFENWFKGMAPLFALNMEAKNQPQSSEQEEDDELRKTYNEDFK